MIKWFNQDKQYNQGEIRRALKLQRGLVRKSRTEKSQAGFTLIEIIVAMAIASFALGGILLFLVSSIEASSKTRAMEEAMENARFTMDDLAKRLRTSSSVKTENGRIFFIDNLTNEKRCYKFQDGKMSLKKISLKDLLDQGGSGWDWYIFNMFKDITSCADINNDQEQELVGNDRVGVEGKFEVVQTEIESDNPHRGFVRIIIHLYYNKNSDSPTEKSEVHLQTGVSLLDYERENELIN